MQYIPCSRHSDDVGKDLGTDRIAGQQAEIVSSDLDRRARQL